MTRLLLLAPTALLVACMTLPGSDTPASSRYLLTTAQADCMEGGMPISLSVLGVNAGLDNDRIARLNPRSGQLSYLKDVRWADQLGGLLEQRLAGDLECRGFAVMSGHRHSLGQPRLLCEVRAFNLLESDPELAEVALSCVFQQADSDRSIISRHREPLARWSADAAVAALSQAYGRALDDLVAGMR